eukprot:3764724-Alexandrium_andersonii.AAC.1
MGSCLGKELPIAEQLLRSSGLLEVLDLAQDGLRCVATVEADQVVVLLLELRDPLVEVRLGRLRA